MCSELWQAGACMQGSGSPKQCRIVRGMWAKPGVQLQVLRACWTGQRQPPHSRARVSAVAPPPTAAQCSVSVKPPCSFLSPTPPRPAAVCSMQLGSHPFFARMRGLNLGANPVISKVWQAVGPAARAMQMPRREQNHAVCRLLFMGNCSSTPMLVFPVVAGP